MALFAVPNALAETVTITMGGNQYAGTTVLTAATTSEPSEGDYVLFNMGTNVAYTVNSSSDWVCTTSKTLMAGSATSGDTTYNPSPLYVDASSGNIAVGANLIVGSTEDNADVLHFKGSGTTAAVLNGQVSVVNTLARIWNEAGTNYMQGKILAEGKTIKVVGTKAGTVLRLAGGGTIGTLNLGQAGGSVTLSAKNQAGTAASGLEYTITTMASENSTAALTVESGVTLHLTNLNAGKLVNGGTLNLSDYNAGTLSNTGTVNLTNFNGGTLTNGGTLNLTDYNAGTLSNTDTVNLTNFNGGTLTNEGTLNLTNYKSGTLTNTGTVNFVSSSSLGTMLSVGGTLDLSAITTLNVDAADSKNFTRLGSLPTSNGYYKGDVALIGYSGTEEVSIGSITGTGWLDGATITYDSTNKRLIASIVADSGVYCVVTDTNTTDNTALSAEETSLIALGNSAVLGLNAGWDDLKGIDSSGGTINIASGASLSSANLQATAATTITGSGRYTTSSMASYGTNVSLSDDWTGNLVISGATIIGNDGHDIDTFSKKSSLVTLQGVTGHLASGATVTKNLELSKSGTLNGLKINDGFTSDTDTARLQFTLSGSISGNGDLEISKGSATNKSPMAYALTGDLSAWTGYFVTSATHSTTSDAIKGTKELWLSGNSGAPEGSDYHAVISNGIKVTGNGILNVIVSNDNAVLLSGDITAGIGTLNLKVNGSGAKTLGGIVTVNDVTVEAGTLRFTGDKLTVNGSLSIGASTSVENLADSGQQSSSIKFGDAGRIQIAEGGAFTNDGFKYTANGAQATIIGKGVSYLRLHEAGVTVENAVMEKTVDASKDISIALTNVALTADASTGTTTLKGDEQQTLSKISVGSGSTVKMENAHTDSSITLVEGGGRFETTRDFTGTLAGGADATLTAKLAGAAQTGTVVKVDASVGSVDLLNTSSVTVTDMVIGAGQTVGVYSGDSAVSNPTSTVEGALTLTNLTVTSSADNAATLNANLTLNGVLTLNGALTMGSDLTLGSGSTLANTGYAHISDITKDTEITLFSSVDSVTYGAASTTLTSAEVDAHDVFGNLNTGDFTIRFESGNVILKASTNVPEPTTATLSLLALMGLAARRRRKAAK